MKRGKQGQLIVQRMSSEPYYAYLPNPLPPNPALDTSTPDMQDAMEKANRALGRLDGLSRLLPDASLFLYFYVRKEAVLSSQIEGTQSSLSDLLLFESDEVPGVPLDDVQEVSNYVAAMNFGLEKIRKDNFPLSTRLMREMHEVLLSNGRGSQKQPGEFRHSQNWIGGTRPGNAAFVPPPHEHVGACLSALENFLHDIPARTPTLIKAALIHVQFETIHPFLDGNGRLGRLLITLLLCSEGALEGPLLYLSYFFKQHRSLYYQHLQAIRDDGDWEAWLLFFLEGVSVTGDQAAQTAQRVLALFDADRKRIVQNGRITATLLRLHDWMQKRPIFSITTAARELGATAPTVTGAVEKMQQMDMVREISGRQRSRLYTYHAYLDLLSEGAEAGDFG